MHNTYTLSNAYDQLSNPYFEVPEELKAIRAVVVNEGLPLFLNSDAERAFGLSQDAEFVTPPHADIVANVRGLDRLDDDLWGIDNPAGYHVMIGESELYKLIFQADTPEAMAFSEWACNVIDQMIKSRGTRQIATSGPQAAAAMKGLDAILNDPQVLAARVIGTALKRSEHI